MRRGGPRHILRRIITTGKAADMDQCPIETQYLLKFWVNNSELNKSITQYIFEELRRDHNKSDVTEILQVIDGMLSDNL